MRILRTAIPCAVLLSGYASLATQGSGEKGDPGLQRFQPGQWEMTMEVTSVDASGLPPEALTQLRAMMNRPDASRACMTADQAANPLRDLRAGMRQGMSAMSGQLNCEFAGDDTFSGGTVRISAACRPPSGGPVLGRLLMEGGFTATTMDTRFSWTFGSPSPGGPSARLTGTAVGRRLGACPSP
ncbi:MAG TPA: DUF3617 family protein [Allosphingosinicella sp.]|nr:DUF3617 family protein [Allosphingosinicella sp.]